MPKKRKYTARPRLHLEAAAGANLHDAAAEAVAIALHEWRHVILTHNDKEIVIAPERVADLAVQGKLS